MTEAEITRIKTRWQELRKQRDLAMDKVLRLEHEMLLCDSRVYELTGDISDLPSETRPD